MSEDRGIKLRWQDSFPVRFALAQQIPAFPYLSSEDSWTHNLLKIQQRTKGKDAQLGFMMSVPF